MILVYCGYEILTDQSCGMSCTPAGKARVDAQIKAYRETKKTEKAKKAADIIAHEQQREQKYEMQLIDKIDTGDLRTRLKAQVDLALHYRLDDDSSNDQLMVELLIDAANKDYAPAQNDLARIHWNEGKKSEARKLWTKAAQGREYRTYGTGSYHARESLQHYFPDDYEPRWDDER